MKKPYDFYLKTISPIHIGCDEVYEPTGFTIDEQTQQMVVFDPFSFISKLEKEDRDKFSGMCAKGTISSILEIYKFLRNRSFSGRRINVCHGFMDHYHKTLDMPLNNENMIKQELNQFQIPRTAFRSIDQRPYIPGSAIKGALRTAYLNMMESQKKLSDKGKERNARNLEQRLMDYDGIHSDPFRMVKVSDFMPVGDTMTRVVYGINKKKTPTDKETRGLPLLFEIVQPGSVFAGTITVDSPLSGAGIRETVSIENLLKSALLFYSKEKKREEKELRIIGINSIGDGEEVKETENPFLIRIGRHSGAESVTIEGHRDIKIMEGKGRKSFRDHATTIWLSSESKKPSSINNLEPFGWAYLNSMKENYVEELRIREKKWQEKTDKDNKEAQAEVERQIELAKKAAEEEKKKAALEEERRKEEERKKAEFEDMSPEERDIAAFSDTKLPEQRVVEIFNRLDGFSPENKIKAARELKDYWIKNNKWEKKHCSDKQRLKIQKVEKILSE